MSVPAQPNVLLVEDSEVQRYSIRVLLQKAGYGVQLAENGRDALAQLRESRPAVVLTDLHMPELDGLELVKIVSREFPATPVILMTARGSEDIAVDALRNGAASYVAKEETVRDLLEIIERVIVVSKPEHSFGYLLRSLQECNFSFVLTNDRALIVSLVQYIQQLAERVCYRDVTQLRNLGMAVEEALLNALYHGSLELPEDVKQLGREERLAAVKRRSTESPYADRKIHVTTQVSPAGVQVTVRDEGPGFESRSMLDQLLENQSSNLVATEGLRGLLLIQMFVDEVQFNDAGNQIRMIKRASTDPSQSTDTVEFAPLPPVV